jgi:hypothetical protein
VADSRRGTGAVPTPVPLRSDTSDGLASLSHAGEGARTRTLRWGLYGCSTLLIGLVVLMAVVATIAYVDYSEPESTFPDSLAAAAAAAGGGGEVALLPLAAEGADAVHLFAPGATTAAAIDACLGFAWDKSELIAGHLTDGMPGAFVVVGDGEVLDYGWHLLRATPLRLTDWPCGVTAGDDGFAVASDAGVLVLSRAPDGAPQPDRQ